MSKRFMYCCIGILCILIAFEVGASTARGQATGFRVLGTGVVESGGTIYVLRGVTPPLGWTALPTAGWTAPPVPASSLLQYESGSVAITDSGEGWGMVNGEWTDLGPIPGVATVRTSWGQVKDKYRR